MPAGREMEEAESPTSSQFFPTLPARLRLLITEFAAVRQKGANIARLQAKDKGISPSNSLAMQAFMQCWLNGSLKMDLIVAL